MRSIKKILILVVILLVAAAGWQTFGTAIFTGNQWSGTEEFSEIPEYCGEPYTEVNNGKPFFRESDFITEAFQNYSGLDIFGRCGTAYACLGRETLPEGERGSIGMIKPSGWHTATYPDIISDRYLYNRCHLIAWCLSGQNDNEQNLITGTRYMNVSGMLPFEERTVRYIEETGNHVLYRVTPVFIDNNLVASGVLMEACSVEDKGRGLSFCVFCHNVQPGIIIDYLTGDNWEE